MALSPSEPASDGLTSDCAASEDGQVLVVVFITAPHCPAAWVLPNGDTEHR